MVLYQSINSYRVFSSRAIPSFFLCLQNPRVADRKDIAFILDLAIRSDMAYRVAGKEKVTEWRLGERVRHRNSL